MGLRVASELDEPAGLLEPEAAASADLNPQVLFTTAM